MITTVSEVCEIVERELDNAILLGKRSFVFPAVSLSPDDLLIRTVAHRVGCHDISLGMSTISKADKRKKEFKNAVAEEFKALPRAFKLFVVNL